MEMPPADQSWLKTTGDSKNNAARKLRALHGALTCVWLFSVIPTVIWWRESILWVAFMSVWANVVSHATAWQAARVEVNQEDES